MDQALDRALDLEGAARDAFLASLDEPIHEALLPLLRDALREDAFLDHPEAVHASLKEDPVKVEQTLAPDTHIGPYQIEGLIGEGGMGRVFRAHRVDGVFDQTVAVKLVRSSLVLAGSDAAARLRRERVLLATLDHPGIARLLDGGETNDGVPYLVTEFIDGIRITDWADEHALDVASRVRLLIKVAQAVDHAHRRFVVHRDLKPSNVLVTERDGKARPVVLDFGIAKLLDEAEREDASLPLTRTGLRLLTPAYAAPELFEPMAPVTTAVDVYGLGALLYELLSGLRPHGDKETSEPPTTEATRPSKAVLVSNANFDLAQRARALRGDLDTICLKALHPDPARRYVSAAALAEDLERYLDGHPVQARPDTLAYVVGRFVRRNRATVFAAALALLALIGGLGVALIALNNEREARAQAEAAAIQATEASDLLAGLFSMSDPDYDPGHEVTVEEAVEEGVRRAKEVASAPLRAYLFRVLGETYIQLGEPAIADSLLQAALVFYGEDAVSGEASKIRRSLALTRNALADPERVLMLGQQLYRDHRNDEDPETTLYALRMMSRAYSGLGQHDEAVALAEQARSLVGPRGDVVQQLLVSSYLGEALLSAGRVAASIPYLEETLRKSVDMYGRASGETSRALGVLGRAKGRLGEIEEAEALLREAIAFHAERYGAHRVGYPLASLGEAKLRAGQFQQAAAVLDSAVTMTGPIIGMKHPDLGFWLTLRATACNRFGAYQEAEQAANRALAIAEAHTSTPTSAQGQALAQLGLALLGQGQNEDARTHLHRALRTLERPEVQGQIEPGELTAVRAALAALPDSL